MAEVRIQICEDGPLLVSGVFSLVDHQGARVPSPRENVVALCRCGLSATKPFCDGSHRREGFQGALCPPEFEAGE